MLESAKIEVIKKTVISCASSGMRRLSPASEHPDLRMVRKHRAAEMANRNLEDTKIKARNLGGFRS
jgi:hypothetical protein